MFSGCMGKNRNTQVENMYAELFVITENYKLLYNGVDTCGIDKIISAPLKFVVYIDSLSCGVCMINKLYLWQKYIDFANIYNSKYAICFILNIGNKNIDQYRFALSSYPIDYPVLIDSDSEFERSNPHLPKDHKFHTFMINSAGAVIMIGSPLNSIKLEKLFYKTALDEIAKLK